VGGASSPTGEAPKNVCGTVDGFCSGGVFFMLLNMSSKFAFQHQHPDDLILQGRVNVRRGDGTDLGCIDIEDLTPRTFQGEMLDGEAEWFVDLTIKRCLGLKLHSLVASERDRSAGKPRRTPAAVPVPGSPAALLAEMTAAQEMGFPAEWMIRDP
jgi:hypothetical protein